MYNRAAHAALPHTSVVELYVGDNLLDMPDHTVRDALARFSAALGE
jgi:hypothetical protein